MLERDLTHPDVGGVFHRDGKPGMVFVIGIGRVERGFEPEIFDADVRQTARPFKSLDCAGTEILFDGGGDRRVNGDEVAGHGLHDALPDKIAAAGLPATAHAAAELGCAQLLNPFLGAWAGDADGVAGFQVGRFQKMEAARAHGNIVIFDQPRFF